MKKLVMLLMVGFLIIGLGGFVLAASDGGGTGGNSDEVVAAGGQGGENSGDELQDNIGTGTSNQGENSELQNQIRTGNYVNANGKQMQIQEKSNNRIELKTGNSRAETGLKISSEEVEGKTKLKATLSNGKNAEVKVMPDSASEKALTRLRLKTCSEEDGCRIELKEVGSGENAKLAYEVKTQRTSRFLGLFKMKMDVEAQVDAETGKVIRTKKPWWAFLASEPAE
mgnify:CR=1 FL=1